MSHDDDYGAWCDVVLRNSQGCATLLIILDDVSDADWQRLIEYLTVTDMRVNDGSQTGNGDDASRRGSRATAKASELALHAGPLEMACRYTAKRDIVIEIERVHIRDAASARIVLRLMSTLGRLLDRTSWLACDDRTGSRILQYRPGQGLSLVDQ